MPHEPQLQQFVIMSGLQPSKRRRLNPSLWEWIIAIVEQGESEPMIKFGIVKFEVQIRILMLRNDVYWRFLLTSEMEVCFFCSKKSTRFVDQRRHRCNGFLLLHTIGETRRSSITSQDAIPSVFAIFTWWWANSSMWSPKRQNVSWKISTHLYFRQICYSFLSQASVFAVCYRVAHHTHDCIWFCFSYRNVNFWEDLVLEFLNSTNCRSGIHMEILCHSRQRTKCIWLWNSMSSFRTYFPFANVDIVFWECGSLCHSCVLPFHIPKKQYDECRFDSHQRLKNRYAFLTADYSSNLKHH